MTDIDALGRSRLVLALDFADFAEAKVMAERLRPWFATVKVGLELFSSVGPLAVTTFVDSGFDVFLDLKLHDIPITVRRAARVIGRLGARYVTVHAAGGRAMLEGAMEGLGVAADEAGVIRALALGVTVLTSEGDAPPELLQYRTALAASSGLDGVVCAAPDLALIKTVAPELLTVVPGTRLDDHPVDDQARIASPASAIASGADLLVVGRPITRAADPEAEAKRLMATIGPPSL